MPTGLVFIQKVAGGPGESDSGTLVGWRRRHAPAILIASWSASELGGQHAPATEGRPAHDVPMGGTPSPHAPNGGMPSPGRPQRRDAQPIHPQMRGA
eukprot:361788-Chlamydomonas_euryale.AAC.3